MKSWSSGQGEKHVLLLQCSNFLKSSLMNWCSEMCAAMSYFLSCCQSVYFEHLNYRTLILWKIPLLSVIMTLWNSLNIDAVGCLWDVTLTGTVSPLEPNSVNTSKTWNTRTLPQQEWLNVFISNSGGTQIPWDLLLGKEICSKQKRKLMKVSKAICDNEEVLVQRKREWVDATQDEGKSFARNEWYSLAL